MCGRVGIVPRNNDREQFRGGKEEENTSGITRTNVLSMRDFVKQETRFGQESDMVEC